MHQTPTWVPTLIHAVLKTLLLKKPNKQREREKKLSLFFNAFGHQNDTQAGKKTRGNFLSVFCTQITEDSPQSVARKLQNKTKPLNRLSKIPTFVINSKLSVKWIVKGNKYFHPSSTLLSLNIWGQPTTPVQGYDICQENINQLAGTSHQGFPWSLLLGFVALKGKKDFY